MKETARLEIVQWDIDRIAEASTAFVRTFAKSCEDFTGPNTTLVLFNLIKQIKAQQSKKITFASGGVEMSFSGFPRPIPKKEKAGIIFVNSEPTLAITDRVELFSGRERPKFAQRTEEIIVEMQDHYGVGVEAPPPTVVFTKESFATVRIVGAALLR